MSKINVDACATTDIVQRWEDLNFPRAESYVKKLQRRIATAYRKNEFDKMSFLQNTLIHSFFAKALAVKVVTSNRGRNTPGVDGVLWVSPKEKYDAIHQLRRRGYKPLPLKRRYIPKAGGKVRPLSMPTMKDRAMQTLYKFALEPIGWITADHDSFAYLPGRDARKAVKRYGELLSDPKARWVMKADIKSCFDSISHEWIMEHIPMDKGILRKFLECGYVERSMCYPTERGVPQGGCISSIICNMTLDGMEQLLEERFGPAVRAVRYADDIVIVAQGRKILVQAVTPVVEDFLSERGLSLSQEKTGYYPVCKEIHFLGYTTYKAGGEFVVKPSRRSMDSLLERIVRIFSQTQVSLEVKRNQLNQRVRGWINYFVGIIPIQSLLDTEFEVVALIQRLTGENQLAVETGKIFSQYEKFYY